MNDSQTNGKAGKATERSNLYGFLATAFRHEPSLDFIAGIKSPVIIDALAENGVTLGPDVLDLEADDLAETLAIEYARLFMGPGKHIPPYEAAQREGALWGKATSDVVAFLRSCGYACDDDYAGLPDHIAIELEFMQHMTGREAVAWNSGDDPEAKRCREIERDFLQRHLSCWTPKFCKKVMDGADSTFYREIAALTRGFIESESADMEAVPADCPKRAP